jgi:hypothetical protein
MTKQNASLRAKADAARGRRRHRRAEAIVAQYIHEISGRHIAAGRRAAVEESR